MCGLVGMVEAEGVSVTTLSLNAMTDAIAHRGPDGEGHWAEGNVGLGHRRLAILDLSAAGDQPMFSGDSRYVLTYNGEIYNHLELKVALEKEGCVFRTRTDTEVLLCALMTWKEKAIERLNGMFAFAFWDRKARKLILARDRYGIKPMYYSQQSGKLVFASEQKAILRQQSFRRAMDTEALLEYFTFQNIFTDKTLLRDIKLFPQGSYATLDLSKQGSQLEFTQYWDFNFREPDSHASYEEYCEELSRLFEQAVKRQMVTDVEIGTYLSGGVDSGSITSIAASETPYIKTFTCGFDLNSASGIELAFDERVKAEYMSYLFKTEHYEMVLKAGDMERVMPELAWHMEEPRVGQSYPNYYVAKLAGKFVKVVLSGVGGDEMFGGYPWRYYRAVNNDDFEHYIDKYYQFWQRLIPNSQIKQVFAPIWGDVKNVWTRDIFRDVFKHHAGELSRPEDYINHSLYFEAKTFMHGLLMVEDKLSMAHGIESRVPFLDNDLVNFAMSCPVGLKLKNLAEVIRMNENEPGRKKSKYFEKTKDGKNILRDVMANRIPQNVAGGEKQGFSGPDASWFRGESIEYVKRKLYNPNALIYQWMDASSVQSLLNEHLNGQENRRLFIWSLLSLECWAEKYLH